MRQKPQQLTEKFRFTEIVVSETHWCEVDFTAFFDYYPGSDGDETTPGEKAHCRFDRVEIESVEMENGEVFLWKNIAGLPRLRIQAEVEKRMHDGEEIYAQHVFEEEFGS